MQSARYLLCIVLLGLATTMYAQQPQLQQTLRPYPPQPNWASLGQGLTQEQVADLESSLQLNPDDLSARTKLLSYYGQRALSKNYAAHLFWMIEHHPEDQSLDWGMRLHPMGALASPSAQYDEEKALWEQNLIEHGTLPAVLYHAGLFFENSDLRRAVQLFQQARELQPLNSEYLDAEARIYERAISKHFLPNATSTPTNEEDELATWQAQLNSSTDAALLSRVGAMLVDFGRVTPSDPARQLGLQLLERAIAVDPANPKWKDALVSSNLPITAPTALPAGAVRIGGRVAEANLLNRVEPIYPPLAKAARVQGTVEFTATIGPDGRVQSVQLVRGHPLLVNAAKEALLQWTYRPTLLNGNPVMVVTEISVPFTLPQ